MENCKKFNELCQMVAEQPADRLDTFCEASGWAFSQIQAIAPEVSRQWLDKMEAIRWDNYLSPGEAACIMAKIVNQDGTTGPKWSREQIQQFLESHDLDEVYEFRWNTEALAVMMDVLYSDHAESVRKYVPDDKMAMFFYDMAVEKLEDPDRPRFIREYFGL